MKLYETFYVITNKAETHFLTEDKTFTTELDQAEQFTTQIGAITQIIVIEEAEADEYFTGDYKVGHSIKPMRVDIIIKPVEEETHVHV